MKLVVFGLSVSSSWGNGHATLWRGLSAALAARGHEVVFFERDVPYYAAHRDAQDPAGCTLALYRCWDEAAGRAARELADCDAAIVTSYCPDGAIASELVLDSRAPVRVFYDLDAPVTLERLARGERPEYLPRRGFDGFDLVLSYTGGPALDELRVRLGARRAAALYGCVDPRAHHAAPPDPRFAAALSYLGTWAADREAALEALLVEPARRRPDLRFLVAGPLYPADRGWPPNVAYLEHVAPGEHPAFYCSSPITLSVTRGAMARLGHCPSGRLFEAAACGVAVISDPWPGLERFFAPNEEILVAERAEDVLAALDRSRDEIARIGRAARARALSSHTADHRAERLLALLASARAPSPLADAV